MGMLDRLNDLGFVIGTFFTTISVVLFINIFVMVLDDKLSIYTAVAFLLFGLVMMFSRKKKF